MSANTPIRPASIAFIIDPASQTATREQFGPKRFAVETRLLNGWENSWTIGGERQAFATRVEAEAELPVFLAAFAEAVAVDDIDDGHDREDYRIVEVAHD